MIRSCVPQDNPEIFSIVNDAATAYRGVIPAGCYQDVYMSLEEVVEQIAEGVKFWGWEEEGRLTAVMGIQPVRDVTLIRHAYVRTSERRKGFGGLLLRHLLGMARPPVLVGTWRAADWAIRFYEKHGFCLVEEEEKNRLLHTYWNIPERQVETSAVLRLE